MIFGFNTDIKQGDTVFHVQSEARQSEQVFQTQVFVRGRCIGKHESSYALASKKPEFTDEHMQELLRNQHRMVLDSIRDGKVNELLGIQPAGRPQDASKRREATSGATAATPKGAVPISELLARAAQQRGPAAPEQPADKSGSAPRSGSAKATTVAGEPNSSLVLEWLNANGSDSANVEVRLKVSEAGRPLADVRIFCRVDVDGFTSVYAQGNTDLAGGLQLNFPIAAVLAHGASVLLQATHENRMITKKFRIS